MIDDKTRAEAIAYADAMVAWLEDDGEHSPSCPSVAVCIDDIAWVIGDSEDCQNDFPPRPSLPVFDLARRGAERAIDEMTDYGLAIDVRWRSIAAMLRLGWCPGDPVPAEIIARWQP